jgi:hypothetical protein
MSNRQFVDLLTFFDDHYTRELCDRVAKRDRSKIQGMMDAGEIHRQVLVMNFGLAVPGGMATIHEVIFGQMPRSMWEYPFDTIAAGKNLISAREAQLSRLIQEFRRGQLVKGDTKFWGNWMHGPILVSCSGAMPWFDTAFANAAGSMVLAELEKILHDEYGMTAKQAGLVTGDGTTLPIFAEPALVPGRPEGLREEDFAGATHHESIVTDRPDADSVASDSDMSGWGGSLGGG